MTNNSYYQIYNNKKNNKYKKIMKSLSNNFLLLKNRVFQAFKNHR